MRLPHATSEPGQQRSSGPAAGRHRHAQHGGRHRAQPRPSRATARRGAAGALMLALLGAGAVASDQETAAPQLDIAADPSQRTAAASTAARSAPRSTAGATAGSVPSIADPPATAPPPRAVAPQASPTAEPEPEPEPEPSTPSAAPVGGLNQQQMDHAATIVATGQRAGLPRRALVVAIATVLQESYLRNLANPAVPASYDHRHERAASDHDSVGLFQQRPSMGWGTVAQLMDPSYAATKFFEALQEVPGWQELPVTAAAQAVQRSAFPDYYAKHEPLAREVVNSLT